MRPSRLWLVRLLSDLFDEYLGTLRQRVPLLRGVRPALDFVNCSMPLLTAWTARLGAYNLTMDVNTVPVVV